MKLNQSLDRGRVIMMKTLIFVTLSAVTLPPSVRAETPMNAEEFAAFTTNKTMLHAESGTPLGMARYLPGQRLIWTFSGNPCVEGTWTEVNGMICVSFGENYGDPADPDCWSYYQENDKLLGYFETRERSGFAVTLTEVSDPTGCLGDVPSS
jgi:hypothetical protein